VHGTGIITDQRPSRVDQSEQFRQGSEPDETFKVRRIDAAKDFIRQSSFAVSADETDRNLKIGEDFSGQFCEPIDRPAVTGPGSAGRQGDEMSRLKILGSQCVVNFLFRGVWDVNDEVRIGQIEAEQFADRGDTIDDVRIVWSGWQAMGIKNPSEFAFFGWSDPNGRAGDPGEKSAAEKALEVEDQIEILISEPAEKFSESFGDDPAQGEVAEASPIEFNQFVDHRMAAQEVGQVGSDHPGDSGVWIAFFQCRQDRHRGDDVARGRGFDDQDVFKFHMDHR